MSIWEVSLLHVIVLYRSTFICLLTYCCVQCTAYESLCLVTFTLFWSNKCWQQMNCTIASTAVVRIIVGLLGRMELTATVFKLFVESWPNFVNCKLLPLAFVMVVVALLFGSYSGRGRSGWWSYESSADSTPSTSQQHGWRVRQGRQSGAQLRYVRTSCATQAKMHAHIYGKKCSVIYGIMRMIHTAECPSKRVIMTVCLLCRLAVLAFVILRHMPSSVWDSK